MRVSVGRWILNVTGLLFNQNTLEQRGVLLHLRFGHLIAFSLSRNNGIAPRGQFVIEDRSRARASARFSPSETIYSSLMGHCVKTREVREGVARPPYFLWRVQLLRKCISLLALFLRSRRRERIAPSQIADREHECDPENVDQGLTRIPALALNEKAIRENIQTLLGGGDDGDVISGERGECHSNEITFGEDIILEHKRTLTSSSRPFRGNRGFSLRFRSSILTLLTQ